MRFCRGPRLHQLLDTSTFWCSSSEHSSIRRTRPDRAVNPALHLTSAMDSVPAEQTPLLGQKKVGSSGRARRYLTQNIRIDNAYIPLLLCCFLTGLIDAGSYSAWSVFMGMQTGYTSPLSLYPRRAQGATTKTNWLGNTIFLALGTANLPPGSDSLKWARSGISILSLVLGSFITGHIYTAVGPLRRLTLTLSFLLQAICIAIAALLVQTGVVPESAAENKMVLIAIPFLAVQSGAQVVTAKSLGFNEVPTTVLTSVYNDLASDSRLLAWKNPKRDRRVGAAVMLLLGGISAGWLLKASNDFTAVLWMGAAMKLLLSFSWLLFRADVDTWGLPLWLSGLIAGARCH